jgi:biopolymer transport protein ExbB/TolQ
MSGVILITDLIEKGILILMFGLSIWTVAIILERLRFFKSQKLIATGELGEALRLGSRSQLELWVSKNANFVGGAVSSILSCEQPLSIERKMASYTKEKRQELEKGLGVLATLGANAPFIGLFGTVLGIIRAFAYVGSQAGSSAVMTGVSQALYATALGLFVAIPSVIAYNYFAKLVRETVVKAESIRDSYIAQLVEKSGNLNN